MKGRTTRPTTDGGVMAERPEFSAFVAVRSTALLRTAYLLTGDHAAAEDLLQTALAKCWKRWSRIEEPEPYVHATMLNTYLSWRARRWSGEVPTGELPEREVGDRTGEADERAFVLDALRRLPRRQRAVVVLRYFEDLSEAETARLLGVSVGTVKSQCSKALASLRVDDELSTTSGRPTPGTSHHDDDRAKDEVR